MNPFSWSDNERLKWLKEFMFDEETIKNFEKTTTDENDDLLVDPLRDDQEIHNHEEESDDDKNELSPADVYYDDSNEENDLSNDTLPIFESHKQYSMDDFQKQFTRFLLELREEHLLPLGIIRSISDNVVYLLDIVFNLISQKTEKVVNQSINNDRTTTGTTVEHFDMILGVLDNVPDTVERTTKSEYHFHKLCVKFFNYLSPKEIPLTPVQSPVPIQAKVKQDYAYYIPLHQSLYRILSKEEMVPLLIHNIRQQKEKVIKDDDLMFSFRDGKFGENINDNSVVNTNYLKDKERSRRFYKPIIEDLNRLQSNGLTIDTFDSQLLFKFTSISGDNLAAHNIGNFQQSFSSGYFCRRCLVSYKLRTVPLTDLSFLPRNESQHNHFVQMTRINNQSVYGIVGESDLNELNGFHPTTSLPGDVMHDYCEGTCPMIIMCMLKEASRKKLLTYAQIEERTDNFIYGSNDKSDKPPTIQIKHIIKERLCGSASQKLLLFRLFPIIFADVTDQLETFAIYLVLREMVEIVLALPIRKSWLSYLKTLEIRFQCLLSALLPDEMPPKVHFCCEYSGIIRDFGPPVRYWCMRYEGRHFYFKKIALRTGNFKNISKTLSTRNQYKHCLLLSKCKFLKLYNETSCVKQTKLSNCDGDVKQLLYEKFDIECLSSSRRILECQVLIHNHVAYKQNSVMVYDVIHEEDTPLFLRIHHIFKINTNWVLIIEYLTTELFDCHLSAYELTATGILKAISPNDIEYYHKPLDIYLVNGVSFVSLSSRVTKH
ncbi:unnamed protein product [Didymodactylos carnosus]|uniref:Uncharacterized protein n=1 Tax=Didymodactylos carnosus TaxID=1234261 RepID=A0A815K440_9BILA|nr:unnamed protein product [Didymodactylos carnosus]CAF4285226.1 unnamed protein product [Didymodactylos carnosus]